MADRELEALEGVDSSLAPWRQGDCVLGEHWFVFRIAPALPITPEAEQAAKEQCDTAEARVRGLMVATQTCDIVRACRSRPYIEVSPLVEVEESVLEEVRRHRRPNYAWIHGVAAHGLVADLDRVMTVEKSVIRLWERIPGCANERQARQLSLALQRKRGRVAFPDDFVHFARPLVKRLREKHNRGSPEGTALRQLREIRVRAAPSWDAEEVDVFFYFIMDAGSKLKDGDNQLEKWLGLVEAHGRFTKVSGILGCLEDFTACDYVESDPLDLDHLSMSRG